MTYKYLLFFIFVCTTVEHIEADKKLCQKLKPCSGRGDCYRLSNSTSENILSIACSCRNNYTGQWCQYLGK